MLNNFSGSLSWSTIQHKHKNSIIIFLFRSEGINKWFVGAGSSPQWAQPTTEAITEVGPEDQVGSGEVATITVEARDFGIFNFSFLLSWNVFCILLFVYLIAVVELELECHFMFNHNLKYMLLRVLMCNLVVGSWIFVCGFCF